MKSTTPYMVKKMNSSGYELDIRELDKMLEESNGKPIADQLSGKRKVKKLVRKTRHTDKSNNRKTNFDMDEFDQMLATGLQMKQNTLQRNSFNVQTSRNKPCRSSN